MTKLTPRQARFVEEYMIDLKGKAAAIRAGYAPRSAKVKAYQILQLPRVQAAVQAAKDRRARATGITAERVLDEIAVVAFSDLRDHLDDENALKPKKFKDMPAGTSRALESMSETRGPGGDRVAIKTHDKMKALGLLVQHLGICKEPEHPIDLKVTAVFQMPRPGKADG